MGPTNTSVNRRSFFRRLFLEGMEQAQRAGRRVLRQSSPKPDRSPGEDRVGVTASGTPDLSGPMPGYLRPPGALPEAQFADTCSRCAKCVQACPAQCIKLEPNAAPSAEPVRSSHQNGKHVPGAGLPYIIARQSPCVVCDDLACMNVCPTGALRMVERVDQIRMGLANVDFDRCLRAPTSADPPGGTHGGKEDCRICVEHCPVGHTALDIGEDGRIEVRHGCIGCGVCEWACPTEPASIMVIADRGSRINPKSQIRN